MCAKIAFNRKKIYRPSRISKNPKYVNLRSKWYSIQPRWGVPRHRPPPGAVRCRPRSDERHLLPAVCKYNARHSADAVARQATAKAILWAIPEMRALAESKGLIEGESGADLGDMLDVFVRELGLVRTLAEAGVGRDNFDKLAEFVCLTLARRRIPCR
ncbi:hypothetical protein B0H19DRAFT_286451 [Mycena capillaripes]|nr:hypothetical protein B0H19DRAFT_286451 [Mycena capillaripes]